jgi:NADPH-dependent F420 reductase
VTTIGIVGGTGALGCGLALRLAAAGEPVLVGSRVVERARATADRVRAAVPEARVDGLDNGTVVARASRLILAVPFEGLVPFLDEAAAALAGKLVVDVVVPLAFEDGVAVLAKLDAPSAGELIQTRIPRARVVSAFKNLPAVPLADLTHPALGDVILCGNDDGARAEVAALVRKIPTLRPVDAGPIQNSRHLEALTALLVNVNRRHHAHTSVTLTGLPPTPTDG